MFKGSECRSFSKKKYRDLQVFNGASNKNRHLSETLLGFPLWPLCIIYLYVPRSRMTLVFVGKGLVLGGEKPFKNRGRIGAPGIYIYTHISTYLYHLYLATNFPPTTIAHCSLMPKRYILLVLGDKLIQPLIGNPYIMGPYKPLRTWVDFPIPY